EAAVAGIRPAVGTRRARRLPVRSARRPDPRCELRHGWGLDGAVTLSSRVWRGGGRATIKFSQEHEEIRRTMKKFIDAEINPHVDEWEAAEQFPAHEVFKKLGKLGMLGLTKPEAYGGAALDYSYSMVFAETLGQIRCGGVP